MSEVERAVATLPVAQRAVLILRDVEGLTAAEACQLPSFNCQERISFQPRSKASCEAAWP